MKHTSRLIALICALCLLLGCVGCGDEPPAVDSGNSVIVSQVTTASKTNTTVCETTSTANTVTTTTTAAPVKVSFEVPKYTGETFAIINDNEPFFAVGELSDDSFESYSPLDSLGRCGVAVACIGSDLMPTEERESLSSVTPSGWHNNPYSFVDGGYLYNRCHLIGFQLTGENANEKNLITGTRYFNVEGMLPFENMVADYIKETDNHVMLRVTPYYDDDNLVASGVLMEGYSVEDNGEGVCFNVFVYNVQPGVDIDYATGENREAYIPPTTTVAPTVITTVTTPDPPAVTVTYILNTNTKKIHRTSCHHVKKIKPSNYQETAASLDSLQEQGYVCCKVCF